MIQYERKKMQADAASIEPANGWPEWVRVPTASKACEIGRTRLYELLNEAEGAIRTCLLKSPGAERGARLIHLPSLFGYLEALAISQQKGLEVAAK
jgi:hypothetical protein